MILGEKAQMAELFHIFHLIVDGFFSLYQKIIKIQIPYVALEKYI